MRSHADTPRTQAPPVVNDVLRSPGRPLDPSVRGEMEAHFGHDFSTVRVHTDGQAAESARAMNASAYTVGSDVVFGAGGYAPATFEGNRLLAHELAHTVQQRGATTEAAPVAPSSPLETAASSAGRAVAGGQAVRQSLGTSGRGLARQESSPDIDFELEATVEQLLRSATRRRVPLAPEQEDQVIAVLAWYRETHSWESFFTVIGHSDDVYALLAPWGFSGGLVSSRAPGMQRPHELLESFDRAIAAWKADDLGTRSERRRRTQRFGGSYLRMPTVAEREYEASQLVTGPLPGGGVYTGPRGGLKAAEQQAEAQITLSKLQAVRHGGPVSLLGRVVGATSAWISGGDVQAGGERGAAIGALGDVFIPTGGRGRKPAAPPPGKGSAPLAPRPRPAIVEKAPPREPMPTPDPPAKAGTPPKGKAAAPKKEAVPEPIEDAPTNPIAAGAEIGERVGGFRILGEKGLKGTAFEREIWGIKSIDKPTTERGVGPVLQLFKDLTAEARAAGATELRITGQVVRNKNILKMKPLVEKLGGTFERTGPMTVEIVIPLPTAGTGTPGGGP